MAGLSSDLEVLKDIPGYKAILKSVLKSQIQLLIEQLSDHTGEETIILTASVHDGTLSHLGSITGKGFLDGRDEIKSQFLAFCLKSHHKRKSTEARSSPYQRPQSGGQGDRLTPSQSHTHKRARIQPVSLQRAGTGESTGNSFTPPDMHRAPSQNFNTNGQDTSSGINVKLESSEQSVSSADSTNYATTSVSFPTSLQLSHTQTSAEPATSDNSEIQNDDDFTEQTSENDDSTAASIKIEPITENEMELEITGVEPGKSSASVDSWGQGQMPGTSAVGEGVPTEAGDQSGYIADHLAWLHNLGNEQGLSSKGHNSFSTSQKTGYTWKSPHLLGLQNSDSEYAPLYNQEDGQSVGQSFIKVKRLKCEFCSKWFAGRGVLNRHMLIHTGERPWKCPRCPKAFNRKSTMQTHMLQHMNLDIPN